MIPHWKTSGSYQNALALSHLGELLSYAKTSNLSPSTWLQTSFEKGSRCTFGTKPSEGLTSNRSTPQVCRVSYETCFEELGALF